MKREKPKDYETFIRVILLLLMFVTVCFIIRGGKKLVSSVSSDEVATANNRPCVVIDAGHGGSK